MLSLFCTLPLFDVKSIYQLHDVVFNNIIEGGVYTLFCKLAKFKSSIYFSKINCAKSNVKSCQPYN